MYIAIYESFVDLVEDNIYHIYHLEEEDRTSPRFIAETTEYRTHIEKRKVDENGNKNVLKASMLWLVDEGAISSEEYNGFLKIKEFRNNFVHKLTNIIFREITDEEINAFIDMFEMYKKITKWWINEIDIPSSGNISVDEYNRENVTSVMIQTYEILIGMFYDKKVE